MMEVSPVFLSQNRGNSWDFQRGCGCVLCLVWSRGPTALALILWRPSLPLRAELLIKKPSAQTEPFHLELWHPWHSLCLFIAVLLAARSQFCLKATWISSEVYYGQVLLMRFGSPSVRFEYRNNIQRQDVFKTEIWIYSLAICLVCLPSIQNRLVKHTLSKTSPVYVPVKNQTNALNVLFWFERIFF